MITTVVIFTQIANKKPVNIFDIFYIIIPGTISISIFLLIGFVFIVIKYKIIVTEKNISCHTVNGKYTTVRWGDIISAYHVDEEGIQSINFFAKGVDSPLEIPLAIKDFDTLKTMVSSYAGSDNPLSKALQSAT